MAKDEKIYGAADAASQGVPVDTTNLDARVADTVYLWRCDSCERPHSLRDMGEDDCCECDFDPSLSGAKFVACDSPDPVVLSRAGLLNVIADLCDPDKADMALDFLRDIATRESSDEGNATSDAGPKVNKPNTPQTPTPKVEDSVVEVGGERMVVPQKECGGDGCMGCEDCHSGIPYDYWREIPCGHPLDPVALYGSDGLPVCHCGKILDATHGHEVEGAPGPVVQCNCGCHVAVPPPPPSVMADVEDLAVSGIDQCPSTGCEFPQGHQINHPCGKRIGDGGPMNNPYADVSSDFREGFVLGKQAANDRVNELAERFTELRFVQRGGSRRFWQGWTFHGWTIRGKLANSVDTNGDFHVDGGKQLTEVLEFAAALANTNTSEKS